MSSLLDKKISLLTKNLGIQSPRDFLTYSRPIVSPIQSNASMPDAQLLVGDNLGYLRELAESSAEKFDVCYIDPPYNTGSKFIYEDNRRSNRHPIFGSHEAWISFMLPRLFLAKELLKSTGVIAISIDDYEAHYLKFLMDRVFGEENFICNVVVCRSKNGKGSKRNVATNHEYLLIYGKSSEASLNGELDDSEYNKTDEFGAFRVDGLFRKKGDASLRSDRPNMYYPVYYDGMTGKVSIEPVDGWSLAYPKDSKGIERRWLWGKETAKERQHELFASKNGVIYVKNYAGNCDSEKRKKIRTIWSETNFYTERATNEVTKIFGSKIFDTPKPTEFIKKIIDICGDSNSLILDFFAGSATTAQAAYELNTIDSGMRKCVLMEIDAPINHEHPARKLGFEKISDITLARLMKIKEEDSNFSFDCINAYSVEVKDSVG